MKKVEYPEVKECLYCKELRKVNWQGFCEECFKLLRAYDLKMRRRAEKSE